MLGLFILAEATTTMGDIPIKLIETVPVAAAIIYTVVLFLKSIDKRDDRLNALKVEWTEMIKDLHGHTMKAVIDASEVVQRNTDALIDVKAVISKCKNVA